MNLQSWLSQSTFEPAIFGLEIRRLVHEANGPAAANPDSPAATAEKLKRHAQLLVCRSAATTLRECKFNHLSGEHQGFSGRIHRCRRCVPGSIPGCCIFCKDRFSYKYCWTLVQWTHGRLDCGIMSMEQWATGESNTGALGQWGERAMDDGTMHNTSMPWIICPRRMHDRASEV